MLSAKELADFYREKFGLVADKDKTKRKKKLKLRDAKKAERRSRYGNKLGHKAVEIQRRKKKQMERIQGGDD